MIWEGEKKGTRKGEHAFSPPFSLQVALMQAGEGKRERRELGEEKIKRRRDKKRSLRAEQQVKLIKVACIKVCLCVNWLILEPVLT